MPTFNKVRSGKIAKLAGQQFELILDQRCRSEGITAIRIPDGCRQVRSRNGYTLLRVATPFDFCLLYKTHAITIDCKTIEKNNFTHSNLKDHQVHSLYNCSKNALQSGYIIWYRDINEVYFHPSTQLKTTYKGQHLVKTDPSLFLGNISSFSLLKLFKRYLDQNVDNHAELKAII